MYIRLQDKFKLLNVDCAEERLENLKKLLKEETEKPAVNPKLANNHIHTIYSFSPYSPTAAVYAARAEGLQTAGIMDHDSIGGAEEFRKAGEILGVGTTCGIECRVSMANTEMAGLRFNNPDQKGVAYIAIHSVPADKFSRVQEVFSPLREKRNIRNKKMVANINSIMAPYGIELDFEKEVVPLSSFDKGGSVTERHLLYALALKILSSCEADKCVSFIRDNLNIPLSEREAGFISDLNNPHRVYDLLGVLKAQMVEKIYIPATDECMLFEDAIKLADEIGAILCYPYLGDVKNSVTGDKKAAKFEDDILDDLFKMLVNKGVHGITYMPSRNTPEQIARLQKLCRENSMTEISGEDVNSSRQSMICKQLELPEFKHLVDVAWELVRREQR